MHMRPVRWSMRAVLVHRVHHVHTVHRVHALVSVLVYLKCLYCIILLATIQRAIRMCMVRSTVGPVARISLYRVSV